MSNSGFPPPPPSPFQNYSVPPPPQDNRNGWQKLKTWQKIVIPVAGVFTFFGVVGAVFGEDTAPTEAKDNTSQSSAADEPAATKTSKPAATAEPVTEAEPTEKATPKATPKPKPTKTAEPKPDAVSVDAADLLKAYEDNEAAADEKYSGKTLKVTGNVAKVDTELFDNDQYVIMLNGGGDFEFLSVNCNDVSREQASKIEADSTITVIGKFDDGGDLGIEMKDCSVV